MSFDALIAKALPHIIKYVDGCELVKFRRVCKTWKNMVDDEDTWKEVCAREFGDVEEAQRKSSLTWRELYKSLSLWSKIKLAKLDYYQSEELDDEYGFDKTRKFRILKNGLISYPGYSGEPERGCTLYHNAIIYYDADDLYVHHVETFDFLFDEYEESDDLYVFREPELKLTVMPKANKKKFLVGTIKQFSWGDYSKFRLIKNNVYFKTNDNTIWVSTLKEEHGEVTVETTPLDKLTVSIVALTMVKDNHVNILTYRGHIFSIKDKKLKFVYKIDESDSTREILRDLKEHAFDWSSPEVYNWLSTIDFIQITKLKKALPYKEGKCIIVGTLFRSLHIYYNPYKLGELVLYITAKPTLKVDLTELFGYDYQRRWTKIEQIDVIEMVNGHRIVILYCNKLVIVEFMHENDGEEGKATPDNDTDTYLMPKRSRVDYDLQATTSGISV